MADFVFEAEIIHWRGPAPFFFLPLPPEVVEDVRQASRQVSYGWGMIPVDIVIGGIAFTTSLFPKDEGYLLPIKTSVRQKLEASAGDRLEVEMDIRPRR